MNTATKATTITAFIAKVRKPMKAISCFRNAIASAISTKILPHFAEDFTRLNIIRFPSKMKIPTIPWGTNARGVRDQPIFVRK